MNPVDKFEPYITPTIQDQIQHIWNNVNCPACERVTRDFSYITKSGHLHSLMIKYTPTPNPFKPSITIEICSSCYEFMERIKLEENIREDWYPEIEQFRYILQHPNGPTVPDVAIPVAANDKLLTATDEQVLLVFKACQARFPNQLIPRNKIPLPETSEEKSIMNLMIRMLSDYALQNQDLLAASPVPNSVKRGTFKNRALQCFPFYKYPNKTERIEATIDELIKRGLIIESLPPTLQRGRQGRYLSSPYVNPVHPDLYDAIRET